MKQVRISHDLKESLIRAEKSEDGNRYFVGYAAVYNMLSRIISENRRTFHERLEPGCFDKVLNKAGADIVLTINHEKIYILARTTSGTLILETDQRGLKFKALVPDTQAGNDAWEMINRGDYTDCSFSFNVDESGELWERDQEVGLIHVVKEVSELYDVAICTLRGAYEGTVIDVERVFRAQQTFEIEDREEILNLKKENQALKEQVSRLMQVINCNTSH
jgi:HK97 family phage prohead protease